MLILYKVKWSVDESSWPKGCGPWVFVVPLLPANTSSYPSHPSLLPFFSTSFSSKPSTLPWLPLKSVHFLPYLGHWLPSSEAAWRHQETFISSWVLRNCETASNQTVGFFFIPSQSALVSIFANSESQELQQSMYLSLAQSYKHTKQFGIYHTNNSIEKLFT